MANYPFAPKGIESIAYCIRAFWSFTTKMPKYNCESAARGERSLLVFLSSISSRPSHRSFRSPSRRREPTSPPSEPTKGRRSSRSSRWVLFLGNSSGG